MYCQSGIKYLIINKNQAQTFEVVLYRYRFLKGKIKRTKLKLNKFGLSF